MSAYRFLMHRGECCDHLGAMEFAGDDEAGAFARLMIRDLMREGEHWADWTMDIKEGERVVGRLAFED